MKIPFPLFTKVLSSSVKVQLSLKSHVMNKTHISISPLNNFACTRLEMSKVHLAFCDSDLSK